MMVGVMVVQMVGSKEMKLADLMVGLKADTWERRLAE